MGLEGMKLWHGNTSAPHLHSLVTGMLVFMHGSCMEWGGTGLCEALAVWAACVCVFKAGGA